MADTIVISSAPPQWQELTDVTWPTQKAWADASGFDFYTDVSDLYDDYHNMYTGVTERLGIAGFRKIDLLEYLLPRYRRAIWLDADLVITNIARGLPQQYRPILLPFDFNGHNATVMGFFNMPIILKFLWAVNHTGRKLFLKHDWKEMEAMRYFLMTPPYAGLAEYVSAKELCPLLVSEYVPWVPLHVSEDVAWTPGDWSLHLSALPLQRRVELARKYAQEESLT